ncbi:Protein CBG17471 [Caenorhabditis briggsae]|uniref:Protein CBG17471 n=1 Tax=Caenorhabditis briggsae TaxID=6238 RepID=A8XR44_CAEBR|nr:Protein CBG17471 [Caenorhabditis briggsae]CAP35117.1 Protein CBG17471 [Caenorhabditis briggsae]
MNKCFFFVTNVAKSHLLEDPAGYSLEMSCSENFVKSGGEERKEEEEKKNDSQAAKDKKDGLNPYIRSPDVRIPGSPNNRGLPDHRITGFPDHRNPGIPDFGITGIPESRITGFPDVRIPGSSEFRIPGFPEPSPGPYSGVRRRQELICTSNSLFLYSILREVNVAPSTKDLKYNHSSDSLNLQIITGFLIYSCYKFLNIRKSENLKKNERSQ